MENYNLSGVTNAPEQARQNAVSQYYAAKSLAEQKKSEYTDPLELLGGELARHGISGVARTLAKKTGLKSIEKITDNIQKEGLSKGLNKTFQDAVNEGTQQGAQNISRIVKNTTGVNLPDDLSTSNVVTKAQKAVKQVTSEAQQSVSKAVSKATGEAEQTVAKATTGEGELTAKQIAAKAIAISKSKGKRAVKFGGDIEQRAQAKLQQYRDEAQAEQLRARNPPKPSVATESNPFDPADKPLGAPKGKSFTEKPIDDFDEDPETTLQNLKSKQIYEAQRAEYSKRASANPRTQPKTVQPQVKEDLPNQEKGELQKALESRKAKAEAPQPKFDPQARVEGEASQAGSYTEGGRTIPSGTIQDPKPTEADDLLQKTQGRVRTGLLDDYGDEPVLPKPQPVPKPPPVSQTVSTQTEPPPSAPISTQTEAPSTTPISTQTEPPKPDLSTPSSKVGTNLTKDTEEAVERSATTDAELGGPENPVGDAIAAAVGIGSMLAPLFIHEHSAPLQPTVSAGFQAGGTSVI